MPSRNYATWLSSVLSPESQCMHKPNSVNMPLDLNAYPIAIYFKERSLPLALGYSLYIG